MQLIILIIFITALWLSFGLPYILSKMQKPTLSLPDLEAEFDLSEPKEELEFDGPDSYEYLYNNQVVRVEKGSEMYMRIYQSLNRRR